MEVGGQLHATAALPPEKESHGTGRLRGWVGLRAGLDAVAKRKIPRSCWESNTGPLARSLVTILTELSG